MERVGLYCGGAAVGEVTLESGGSRVEIRAAMPAPGDGLYRVTLLGELGELSLGVLEPCGGQLVLRRCPYRRDVAALGRIDRGEARRSFAFSAGGVWRRTARPWELFHDQYLRERLSSCGTALWRREGAMLQVALPFVPTRPFPLESLFCLARLARIEGQCWAVYTFDGAERPQCAEIYEKID